MAKGVKTGGRQPGSINKVTADVKLLAQKHGPRAIARLAHLMDNAESETAQAAAAKELLDRAYGKSVQAVSLGNPDGTALGITVTFVSAK